MEEIAVKKRSQKKRVIDRKDYLTTPPQYGVHFGHVMRDFIKAQGKKMTIGRAAALLGISEQGLKNKFNMPHGGDLYFFIKASIALEHDFFQYARAVMENKGKLPEDLVKHEEYIELKGKYDTIDKMYKRMMKENEVLYENIEFLKKKIAELEREAKK